MKSKTSKTASSHPCQLNPKMSRSPVYSRFAGLCLFSLLLWWRALLATIALALQNDAYTHILLILPISIALISLEWRSRKIQPEPNLPTGCALALIAVTIGFVGSRWGFSSLAPDERLSLSMLALVTWWIGSFVCCFGIGASRMFLFPLCFLLWLVPLPEFALNQIVGSLQQGSAFAARLLFTIGRVPVAQDGVRLSIPGLTLEIAKECSSVRSSLMLLVTTMVLAHLLLRSAWGKSLVILVVVPLSIAKNGLRIFVLSMLGAYVDPGFMDGWLHHHGGILFFLLSLAGLLVMLGFVGWIERKPMAQSTVTHLAPPMATSKANT
jgi:exosortase